MPELYECRIIDCGSPALACPSHSGLVAMALSGRTVNNLRHFTFQNLKSTHSLAHSCLSQSILGV